jgi:2'-5' RNA ligase
MDLARRLHGVAAGATCDGRLMRVDTVHLTLAFIGDVAVAAIGALADVGTAVAARHRHFDLALDGLGYWRHKRIVWAAPRRPCAPLNALASDLRESVRGAGLSVDRQSFVAHVTLARQVRVAPVTGTVELIGSWPVHDMVLVASERTPDGARYSFLRQFALLP